MKLFPFILKDIKETLKMTSLKVFLGLGGKALWRTDETALSHEQVKEEYLLPNGLIPKRMFEVASILFVEIDSAKTNLQDFYTWEEALIQSSKPECWRTFSFFTDGKGAEWFSSRYLQGENEVEGRPIHEYYEDILRNTSV